MGKAGDDMEQFEGTDLSAIGRRLEASRLALDAPQQQAFSAKAGIAKNTYNQYERGKKRPSVENAIRLCDTYQLTLDWIYRGDYSGIRAGLRDEIKAAKFKYVAGEKPPPLEAKTVKKAPKKTR